LAKYLPQYGWKPIVLTVDTQYEYNEDAGLLTSLPPEVEIVKARYIEPTLRGLRMALGGKDRTFAAMKNSAAYHPASPAPLPESLPVRGYNYLLAHHLQAPDAFWTWARSATVVGKKLLKERNIGLVFTTAPPYSSLAVGQELQRAGAKWIADFRDPIAYYQRLASDVPRVRLRQRKIVGRALRSANAVTWASSCFGSIYADVFGNCSAHATFIPTGVDAALLEPVAAATQRKPYLIFTGEFLPNYDPDFLAAFAAALSRSEMKGLGLKLLVVGTLELNRKRMMPLVERFGLSEHIEFLDQMPQRELYRLVSQASAGVLLPGRCSRWWVNAAKMTDFIGMRKPVVAIVPDPSEARTALTRSGLGVFLDGSTEQQADRLVEFVAGQHRLPPPNESECERYTVHAQVKSFVELFERVCASR
jgi:glycosyltransferase involved in cell wall biosynthesis